MKLSPKNTLRRLRVDMKSYVTIDGGTTNTRLYLVADLKVERSVKLAVGARNGKDALLSAISGAIGDLVSNTSELV